MKGKVYPINWAGARCGLSLGDLEYLNRYGIAYGFRVQLSETTAERWADQHDGASTYFNKDGRRRPGPPDRGEWYLLDRDVREVGREDPATVDSIPEYELEAALEERRDYPIRQDLRPRPVDLSREQRELELVSTDVLKARREEEVVEEHGITGVLRGWTRRQNETVNKYLRILRAIDDRELETYGQISDASGVSLSSVKSYMADHDQLAECREKDDEGVYRLTPVGTRALETDWSKVLDELGS